MHDSTHLRLWRALAGAALAWVGFICLFALLTQGRWWPTALLMMKLSAIPCLAVALSADPGRWLRLFLLKRRRRLDVATPLGAVGPFDRYHELTLSEDLAFDLTQGGFLQPGGAFKAPQGATLHLKTGATTFAGEPSFSLTLELTDAHGQPLPDAPWTRSPRQPEFRVPMHPDKEPALYWAAWTACAKAEITLKTPRGTFTPAQMALGAEDRLQAQLDWLRGAKLDAPQKDERDAPRSTSPHPLPAPLCAHHNDRETLYHFTDGTAPEARWAASLTPEDPADATLYMPPGPGINLEQMSAHKRLKDEIKAIRVFVMCSLLGMVTAPLGLYTLMVHSRRPRPRRTLRLFPRWMRLDRTLHSLSSIRLVSAFPVHKGPVLLMTDDSATMIAGLTSYEDRVAWGRHFIQAALKHMNVSSTAPLNPTTTHQSSNNEAPQAPRDDYKPSRWSDLTRLSADLLAPNKVQLFFTVVTLALMAFVCNLHMAWLGHWWFYHRIGLDYAIPMAALPLCPMIFFSVVLMVLSKCMGMSGRLSLANGLHTFSCVAAAFVLTGMGLSQGSPNGKAAFMLFSDPTLSQHASITKILRETHDAQGGVKNMDLSEFDMTDASLDGIPMIQVNLSGVQGRGARFNNAMFIDAELNDAHFHNATFEGASMTHVKAERAIFHESNLTGANMSFARLQHAVLTQANAARSILKDANLNGANLSGANLTDADARNIKAPQANFSGANLRNANLAGADLTGADLTGADLTGAALTGARINPDMLRKATLSDATRCPDGRLAGPERRCNP